jgi:hypothetical protein
VTVGTGDNERLDWRPGGDKIGWVDEHGNLYLEPEASYAAVQRLARDQGTAIPVTKATLFKRLDEKGWILSKDERRKTVRKTIEGRRPHVLHIKWDSSPLQNNDPAPKIRPTSVDHFSGPEGKVGQKSAPQDQQNQSSGPLDPLGPLSTGSMGQNFSVIKDKNGEVREFII